MRIAIIGGSGAAPAEDFADWRKIKSLSPFGDVYGISAAIGDNEIVFIHRHGPDHSVAPHKINHEANIAQIRCWEIDAAIGIFTVGSLVEEYQPGDLIPLSDFINYSFSGTRTFFKDETSGVVHTDFTKPYCSILRSSLAESVGCPQDAECVYIGVDGPRYETPSEIKMFRSFGGHVVGMTAVPETILAREAGLCYAGLALVTNMAAGLSASSLSHDDVIRTGRNASKKLWNAVLRTVSAIEDISNCECRKNRKIWDSRFG